MTINKQALPAMLLLLLCTAPALADDAQKADTHRLTQAQAVKIALAFCQSIGRTGLRAGELLTPAAYRQKEVIPHHWHPHWHVKLNGPAMTSDSTEVEVDDVTGDIVGYDRSGTTSGAEGVTNPIPKEQAVTQATEALAKAGLLKGGELKFDEATYNNMSLNDAEWDVSWTREINGTSYRYQGANVIVNAATGDIKGLGVIFHTPPPDSTAFNVSKEQATAIADQQLAAAGLSPDAPPTVKAEVIQPNTFWQPGGSEDSLPYARVAWTCYYDIKPHYCQVWVDAQTGDVIGGEYGGSRGGLTIDSKAAKKAPQGQPTPAAVPSPLPKK